MILRYATTSSNSNTVKLLNKSNFFCNKIESFTKGWAIDLNKSHSFKIHYFARQLKNVYFFVIHEFCDSLNDNLIESKAEDHLNYWKIAYLTLQLIGWKAWIISMNRIGSQQKVDSKHYLNELKMGFCFELFKYNFFLLLSDSNFFFQLKTQHSNLNKFTLNGKVVFHPSEKLFFSK